jgi:hypothetical protein
MGTKIGNGACSFGLCAMFALPATAHHSWVSDYDGKKPVEVRGVVTAVEWTNPHVHVYVESTDESGAVILWNFEMASVLSLERGGWSRRTLQAGDEITVGGFGGRAAADRAIASSIINSDGDSLFVGKFGN